MARNYENEENESFNRITVELDYLRNKATWYYKDCGYTVGISRIKDRLVKLRAELNKLIKEIKT